jgi:hypothetical protein
MQRQTLSVLLALALGGCEGTLLDRPTGPRGSTFDPGPASCADATLAPTTLSRLTRVEYDNAIEDLLGDTSGAATGFAPDDVTTGFEVGGAVAPLLAEQYLEAATGIAARATEDLVGLTGCTTEGEACARAFVTAFGRRAYRRPLSEDEVAGLVEVYRIGAELEGHRAGIQVALEAMLVSPSFLYHVEGTGPMAAAGVTLPLTGFELASRLSFFLWRSVPDDELLDAAESGELELPEGLEAHARRMLEDGRAERGLMDFHRQWLGLDRMSVVERDATLYPEFSRELASDMRTSLELMIRDVLAGSGALDELFRGDFAYVNERLAPIYGLSGITGTELRRVAVDPDRRAGLLTHPAMLTMLGKSNQSDPVHRGIFVRERLLCQHLPPPPPGLMVTPPDLQPGLTTRERFAQHRSDASCASCHRLIDPIGFGFESFDALGRFRTEEEGLPIDASGEIVDGGDANGPFDGVVELSERLAQSDAVRACVSRQWFRYALGRVETNEDRCSLESMRVRFEESGFDLRELVVALVTTDAFTHRRIPAESGSTSPSP